METRYRSNNATRKPKRFTCIRKAKKARKEFVGSKDKVKTRFNVSVIISAGRGYGNQPSKMIYGVYFTCSINNQPCQH